MTPEKFKKLLSKKGYVPSPDFELTSYDIWEKPGSNILIEVRKKTFVRTIRFENGNYAYIESLWFSKHECLN